MKATWRLARRRIALLISLMRLHRLVGFGVALLASSLGAQQPRQLTQFLREGVKLDAAQMTAVETGEPVVKVLETQHPRDVAVFGIIATGATRGAIVARLRDFPRSLAIPSRVRFGLLSTPATAADVQALVIGKDDVDDAKKCKPGDCNFKLPKTEMARFKGEVNWSARNVEQQLTTYARRQLVLYVEDYRAHGDSVLVVYDDKGGVSASDAFNALLANSPYLFQFAPALASYLRNYPREKLPGATEAIYWAEDQAPHLRNTITINHAVLYSPPELPGMSILASKQIYAKHYFEAGFDLTSVVERTNAAAGSYLIVLRRYRFDNLPSGGLLNIKGRVLNSLRDKMIADLKRERAASESKE
jgi:hypothetical protein